MTSQSSDLWLHLATTNSTQQRQHGYFQLDRAIRNNALPLHLVWSNR